MTDGKRKISFLDLPPELRNNVYRYCLVSPRRLQVYKRLGPACSNRTTLTPQLLVCCRQIRDEATAILYGENTICLPEGLATAGYAAEFVKQIGRDNAELVLHLELSIAYLNEDGIRRLFEALKQNMHNLQDLTLKFSTWHREQFSEITLAFVLGLMMRDYHKRLTTDDVLSILRWKYDEVPKEMVIDKGECRWMYDGRRKPGVEDSMIEEYGARVRELISRTFK